MEKYITGKTQSLLSWERGLKFGETQTAIELAVAPLVGAWIEIGGN